MSSLEKEIATLALRNKLVLGFSRQTEAASGRRLDEIRLCIFFFLFIRFLVGGVGDAIADVFVVGLRREQPDA